MLIGLIYPVVGIPGRWLGLVRGFPVRYRGYTRYRGLRYRGLFVFYPDITKSTLCRIHSHCNECPPPQIELNGCGRKDEEDEADEEDAEDDADEEDEEGR